MFEFLTSNLLFQDGKYILLFTTIIIALIVFLRLNLFEKGFYSILLNFLIVLSVSFLAFSFYFFRNPVRVCQERQIDENILISPADGLVVDISKIENNKDYSQKISIFLSPIDVHVNWIPFEGTIEKVIYRPGKFVVAFAPKSSEINERNDIVINCKKGKIQVGQIAGFIARRICCWVKENDIVYAGQKFGMIRFGSRIDIFLPENVEIFLKLGQKIKGGQTAIGKWL